MAEPFPDTARGRDAGRTASRLGMLVFLAGEVMLFGGLFGAALALRLAHPSDYAAAAHRLNLWLGTANTATLLTSSLCAALAVAAARAGHPRRVAQALGGAALLGTAFLVVKAAEWVGEYRAGLMPGTAVARFASPPQHLFMNAYFIATGLHAIHVAIGIALLVIAAASRAARADRHAGLVGNVALYWHLVDVVWVFLYPTLYLAGAR